MRVRMADDWRAELEEEAKDPSFRVLVPPFPLKEEDREGVSYFVWEMSWSPLDQNTWFQYFQDVVKRGVELPPLLLQEFEFATRCLKAENSKDWGSVPIRGNPKFAKLFAVLLGFKALHELRSFKKTRGLEMSLKEKEGQADNPHPGKDVAGL